MTYHKRMLIAALAVALLVAPASASYTTDVVFSAEGWYLSDAGARAPLSGYGLFQELFFDYTVDSGIPEGTHSLYFRPDVWMQLRPQNPGGIPVRNVSVDAAGIDFDGQTATWESMGLTWEDGYGVYLGEHFMPPLSPGAAVGDHAWDQDGGGNDFTASVWAGKGETNQLEAESFGASFAMHRSLTWLSGQPIGTWFAGGLAPLMGGMPLDSLNDALDGFAPALHDWDRSYYGIQYEGSMRLTACAEPVPEPSTILLLSGGLGALLAVRRRRGRTT